MDVFHKLSYNVFICVPVFFISGTLDETKEWLQDDAGFPNDKYSYFIRGGSYNNTTNAGSLNFNGTRGHAGKTVSFRPVLVEQ